MVVDMKVKVYLESDPPPANEGHIPEYFFYWGHVWLLGWQYLIFDILKLYKKRLRVYFIKFIRMDKKFKNSAKLINQMNKDVIFAKKGLKTKLVL